MISDVLARMQGIDHLEDRHDVVFDALLVDFDLLEIPQFGNVFVAKAHLLGFAQDVQIIDVILEFFFHGDDPGNGLQEQHRDHRHFTQFI